MVAYMPKFSGRPATRELLLLCSGVIWLQVVGVVTETVLHHIIHAVPLAVLAAIPESHWGRHTRAMCGLAWVLLLTVFTPMIWLVLTRGITFTQRDLAYTWLAPGMMLIAAAISAVSVAELRGAPKQAPIIWLVIVIAGGVLASAQPRAIHIVDVPVENVLAGKVAWAPVLAIEAGLVVGLIWTVVRMFERPPRSSVTVTIIGVQAAYWTFFVICMIAGLAADEL